REISERRSAGAVLVLRPPACDRRGAVSRAGVVDARVPKELRDRPTGRALDWPARAVRFAGLVLRGIRSEGERGYRRRRHSRRPDLSRPRPRNRTRRWRSQSDGGLSHSARLRRDARAAAFWLVVGVSRWQADLKVRLYVRGLYVRRGGSLDPPTNSV